MSQRYRSLKLGLLSMLALPLAPGLVTAQDATIEATVSVVAGGLTNPRGFTWGPDGTLYVALAGTGGMTSPIADDPASPAASEAADATSESGAAVEGAGEVQKGSETASVVRIDDGCPVNVATGLPSGGLPELGWVFGVSDVEFLQDQLYVLVDGGGDAYGHPDVPNGVYQVNDDGTTMLIADLSAWFRANPVAEPHDPISPDAQPFAMVADGDRLWIAEANHQQVLTVTPDGTITRISDLSVLGNVAPDAIALAPDGGVYVGFLSALPFTDGTAKVVHVAADGTVTDIWTGLTAVTAIAVDGDGVLYALQMATGNIAEPPFVAPGTGILVRQTGPNTSVAVADGMDFPVKMKFDPHGDLFIASPAFGANDGEGTIVKLTISPGTAPVETNAARTSASGCGADAPAFIAPRAGWPR